MIDDAAKRVDWGVMLEGDSFDLEDWESALKPSFDPLDPASDSSSAYERRRALIEQINGALAITHGARNLRLDRIVEILSDGTQRRHALLSVAMGCGRPRKLLARTDCQSMSLQSKAIRNSGLRWQWRSREAKIGLTFGVLDFAVWARGRQFLRLEWADKAEIERLKRTANFERHARRKFDPLPNPMPEGGGKGFAG